MAINWDRKTIGRGSPIPKGFVVIEVDARSLIAALRATDPDFAKFDKMAGVRAHVAAGGKLSLPQVGAVDGRIGFDNGRNRAALAAELGESVPIVVAKDNVAAVRQLVGAHAEAKVGAGAGRTANVEFQDAMLRHQTYLLRFSGSLRNQAIDLLSATESNIAEKILGRLANSKGLTTAVEWRRLRALVEQIDNIRSGAWDKVTALLENQSVSLALAESASIQNMLRLSLPVQIETVLPSDRLLKSIALARPFEGKVLHEWASSMASDDLRRMGNAIQMGMIAGEDMRTITGRVVGTRALNYVDGMTEMTRRQVASVVQTAVMHVSNHARSAFFQENADIIEAERFVATLDSRTTPVCRANDGKQYPLGKGPQPPLHFRCRSLRIAALDGTLLGSRPAKPFVERELVEQYARENKLGSIASRDDLPRGTKGAYDDWARGRVRELIGPVPASTTYSQWLAGQSRAFQDDTLGVTRAKLFRDGKLPLDKFVNRNGDEITLAQLAQRESAAFRAAGLDPARF